MNHLEFRKQFPNQRISGAEMEELFRDGFVAIAVGDRRVFTLRLEWAESDIPETDFSNAKPGVFFRSKPQAVEPLPHVETLDVVFVTPQHEAEVRKHFENLVKKYAAEDFKFDTSKDTTNLFNDAVNLARGHQYAKKIKLEEMSLDDLTELEFQISNEIARR